MSEKAQDRKQRESEHFEIRLTGLLDPGWSDWLGGLTLTHIERAGRQPETLLHGRLRDQASLYGVLAKLRDLNQSIVSVTHLSDVHSPRRSKEIDMNDEYAIQVRGLTKNYGRVRALQGLDLAVLKGEIFGFLGPNGAGKTTTIRCLLDMIRPDGGSTRVLGLDPQQEPTAVRARVGYLPGELHLYDNMKVASALRYLKRLRNGSVDWQYVEELAERLKLDLGVTIKNLSKGNKQKVGVVQAFMHRPELYMLDEPTSGLDPLVQREVLDLVASAKSDGATIFFSSHVLSEVERIADRVGIIREGKLAEIVEPSRLVARSLHRIQVRFKSSVNTGELERLPGVQLIDQEDGTGATLQVEGEMDALVKALAKLPVSHLSSEQPSLEEAFLVHYRG